MNGSATAKGSNLAHKRGKWASPTENTPQGQKTQHARNLAPSGALEREGKQAKENGTRHRPPKKPHNARKASRTSKHTPEEPTAQQKRKLRPSRRTRRGRANAKPRTAQENAPREAKSGTPCQQRQRKNNEPRTLHFCPRRAIHCKY